MPTFDRSKLKKEPFEPQYCLATGSRIRGEQIEACFVLYPAGTEIKVHTRPNEQIHTILKGKAKYRVKTEEKTIGPGEAVLIKPNTEYSAKILEDLEVIDFRDVGTAGGGKQEAMKGSPFFKWDEMKKDLITPKYSPAEGPTIKGERIEVGRFFYPAGGEGKLHSHPNEQIQVPLKGRSEGFIGGEKFTVGPGEVVLIPANTEHTAKCLEDYTTINCKNTIPGWSVHDARWEK
jgi:quercetin dioxygenase-like cupin family protein